MELCAYDVPGAESGLRGKEVVNEVLKEHATTVEDWPHHQLARFLHDWADRFNVEFKLDINTPAISIDRLNVHVLGHYRYGRNGFGFRYEIALNAKHLDRPIAGVLITLLHEMLHEWQEQQGVPGKRNYHNKQFRNKARSYGLIVDQHGYSLGVTPGRFTALLTQYGIDTSVLPLSRKELPKRTLPGNSKLKKWSCGCTNTWAAVELHAQCLSCGAHFQRADLVNL